MKGNDEETPYKQMKM